MLEVNNLCFSYNKKADFIDNMSFKIGCGEHIILFGADDSGKTTLFNLLSGFIARYKGNILFHGTGINKLSKKLKKNIRFVPDNIIMEKNMTAKEYLLWAKAANDGFDSDMSEKLCKLFDIDITEQLLNMTFCKNKLIQIISEVCVGAELVVMDEPCNFIDENTANKLFEVLKAEYKKTSFLIMCENFEDIKKFADRYMFMDNGEIKTECRIDNPIIKWKAVTVRGENITDNFISHMEKVIAKKDDETVFLYKDSMEQLPEILMRENSLDWIVEELTMAEQLQCDFSRWE